MSDSASWQERCEAARSAVAATACVGGVSWAKGSPGPFQHLLRLSRQEACALRSAGRLERARKAAGSGVHLQLLDQSVQEPRLLITGAKEEAVEAARLAVASFLDVGVGQSIALHPVDMEALWFRRRTLLEKLEDESGCRIVLEYKSKKDGKDVSWKQDCVHLLGGQAAQALAVQLLAPHCAHSILLSASGTVVETNRTSPMQSFDQAIRSANISLSEHATVAQRVDCQGVASPVNCIVIGAGYIPSFDQGVFFAFVVRRIDSDRALRGGTRISISSLPLTSPLPDSLLRSSGICWVLGRGMAQTPGSRPQELPGAHFDASAAGDELGVLVTKPHGALSVWRRKSSEDAWELLVCWDAKIDHANGLYAALELSGRLVEVELVQRQPPDDLGEVEKVLESIAAESELPQQLAETAEALAPESEIATGQDSGDAAPEQTAETQQGGALADGSGDGIEPGEVTEAQA